MYNTKSKNILVIDDNEDNLLLMQLMLGVENHQVCLASCGKDGLAQMEKACPDLIILDLMMPDISGFEVIDRAKANCNLSEIPILVLTANIRIQKQDIAYADELCYKPFDVNVLLSKIQSLLSCKQQSSTLRPNSIF